MGFHIRQKEWFGSSQRKFADHLYDAAQPL